MADDKDLLNEKDNQKKNVIDNDDLRFKFLRVFHSNNSSSQYIELEKYALQKFMNKVENGEISISILEDEDVTEIAKWCTLIKEEYFEKIGVITDGNGNPNLEATLQENPEIVEQNPEIARIAEEQKIKKIESILQINDIDEFLDKFHELREDEKDLAIHRLFDFNYENNYENGEIEYDENYDDEIEHSEEENNTKTNGEENNKTQKSNEKIKIPVNEFVRILKSNIVNLYDENKNDLNNKTEVKAEILKNILILSRYLFVDKDDNRTKQGIVGMLDILGFSKEDIKLLESNPRMFEEKIITQINAYTKGRYKSYDEIFGKQIKEISNERESFKNSKKFNGNYFKNNSKKIEEGFEERFKDDPLKEKFYEQLKKVDLSLIEEKNRGYSENLNVYLLVKFYSNLQRSKSLSEKESALKSVLEEMIFSDKYASVFGNYRNGKEINFQYLYGRSGKQVESNGKKVRISSISDELYEKMLENIENGIISKKDFYFKTDDFKNDSRKNFLISDIERDKDILINIKKYLDLNKKLSEITSKEEKVDIFFEIRQLESIMKNKLAYSQFLSEGEVDVRKIENFTNKPDQTKKVDTDYSLKKELFKAFEDLGKFSGNGYNVIKAEDKEKYLAFINSKEEYKKFASGEDFENAFFSVKSEYEKSIADYMEKKSFYEIYKFYNNGKSFNEMGLIQKRHYMESLLTLHTSPQKELVEFSEKILSAIEYGDMFRDSKGNFSDEKILNFYKTYISYDIDSIDAFRKHMINSQKRYFVKEILESEIVGLESLKIDSNRIRNISKSMELSNETIIPRTYLPEEQRFVDFFEKIDTENPENVKALMIAYNEIKNKIINDKASDEEKLYVKSFQSYVTGTENRGKFAEYISENYIKDTKKDNIKQQKRQNKVSKLKIVDDPVANSILVALNRKDKFNPETTLERIEKRNIIKLGNNIVKDIRALDKYSGIRSSLEEKIKSDDTFSFLLNKNGKIDDEKAKMFAEKFKIENINKKVYSNEDAQNSIMIALLVNIMNKEDFQSKKGKIYDDKEFEKLMQDLEKIKEGVKLRLRDEVFTKPKEKSSKNIEKNKNNENNESEKNISTEEANSLYENNSVEMNVDYDKSQEVNNKQQENKRENAQITDSEFENSVAMKMTEELTFVEEQQETREENDTNGEKVEQEIADIEYVENPNEEVYEEDKNADEANSKQTKIGKILENASNFIKNTLSRISTKKLPSYENDINSKKGFISNLFSKVGKKNKDNIESDISNDKQAEEISYLEQQYKVDTPIYVKVSEAKNKSNSKDNSNSKEYEEEGSR